ncbi:biotin-dependent carboxyltransferase family protein [Saccharospirillum impatiens]|uniref:5-oxoprolinase subunit C family protein n=1 Tax=Saccharospirillum impatiens TaxID=169438 RepID=UPI0004036868|nr:biotin-dependent carboxyltransferase family protein [Saccharospirillum impatiens]
MTDLTVRKPGWQTTIQDTGRRGYFRQGLSEGGALDEHAYHWANKLLNNEPAAACLEILLGKFEAEFSDDTVIAVTGADIPVALNGRTLLTWCSHRVKRGDVIRFGQARSGLRVYLGVAGGWQTPRLFGSRSVVMREQLGGLDGGPLKQGDRLAYHPIDNLALRCVPPCYRPDYRKKLKVKVIPGYQFEQFSVVARRTFETAEYTISNDISRMGYKLTGPVVAAQSTKLASEGIAYGSVQVPPDGQPIVLLKDRQTIGGYPKIGCVASLDCARLSQCSPGTPVSFEFCDVDQVQAERRLFDRFFNVSQ